MGFVRRCLNWKKDLIKILRWIGETGGECNSVGALLAGSTSIRKRHYVISSAGSLP